MTNDKERTEWIEKIIHYVIYNVLKLNLSEETWSSLIQFIKFGLVGVLNNLICYVIYIVLITLGMHYTPANIIGFSVSVFNSYYWNNKYVFVTDKKRVWWITFIKTYISYAGTGIILSNILLYIWIDMLNISAIIAPIINLVVTIPINFIVNKFWAYRNG